MFDPRKLLDMVKNAGDIQKNMMEKFKQQKATGEAGGGLIKITMNGHFEVENVEMDETLLKEDKTFVQDLFKAAVNDATAQLRNSMADYLKSFKGSFGF